MNKIITNGHLTLTANSHGAEITSLRQGEREIIWCGDKEYWGEHSPTLFPCIGGNSDGVLRLGGKEYQLRKHGFAKCMEFELVECSANSLTYSLSHTADTLQAFPFQFRFLITYTLQADTLVVTWRVRNCSAEEMPFMVGAHPALCLPDFNPSDEVHGYLRFPEVDCLQSTHTQTHGLAEPERIEPFQLADHLLPLGNSTFAGDTILDCTGRISQVELLSRDRKPLVRIDFHMPVLALWAPKSGCCPFVCVEPWAGCCDEWQGKKSFDQRPFVNHVQPTHEWALSYSLTVL